MQIILNVPTFSSRRHNTGLRFIYFLLDDVFDAPCLLLNVSFHVLSQLSRDRTGFYIPIHTIFYGINRSLHEMPRCIDNIINKVNYGTKDRTF